MARGGGTVLESVSERFNAVELPAGAGAGAVFPSAGDVDLGVTYGPTGADFAGTLEQPAPGDVRNGVGYGAGGAESTGTLVLPAEADVALGVGYGASGTEFTGTLTGAGGGGAWVF